MGAYLMAQVNTPTELTGFLGEGEVNVVKKWRKDGSPVGYSIFCVGYANHNTIFSIMWHFSVVYSMITLYFN